MTITRSTQIANIYGISVRTYLRLRETGCQTIGELLELGPNLHTLIGRAAVHDLAAELPARWRVRMLEPPPKPPRKPPPDAPKVRRVRVHCTRCGRVSSVTTHRAEEPCSSCGGKVERRTKGRPRKQADAA